MNNKNTDRKLRVIGNDFSIESLGVYRLLIIILYKNVRKNPQFVITLYDRKNVVGSICNVSSMFLLSMIKIID